MISPSEKIAIVGDGVAGRYLYRLFKERGQAVTLFGKEKGNECGIRSCAWGTERKFLKLAAVGDIDPNEFILNEFKEAVINGVRVKADFFTIQKPQFLHALADNEEIHFLRPTGGIAPDMGWAMTFVTKDYAHVIDATGVSRVVLPPPFDDLLIPTTQYRLRSSIPLPDLPMAVEMGHQGYLWIFPLGATEFHYGCGSLTGNPVQLLRDYADGSYTNLFFKVYGTDLYEHAHKIEQVCACSSRVRLTGPKLSQPFIRGKVWGVGESIGCVSPLAGAGITPAMECALILLEEIGNAEGYTRAVLKHFAHYDREREILDKLRRGAMINPFDYNILKGNATRAGLKIGLRDAIKMATRMREASYGG